MRTSTYPLTNRLLGGNLEASLRQWRAEGDSFEAMAYRLRTEHAVVVSSATIRRWCQNLGVTDDEEGAA